MIDTGVFVRWEREGRIVDLGQWSDSGSPAISVVTQSELLVGVHRADTPERRESRLRFVQAIVQNVMVMPVDSSVAEVHAKLVATLSQSGKTIGPHDNFIAATAIAHDFELLTTNAREFRRVPDLRVIEYSQSK